MDSRINEQLAAVNSASKSAGTAHLTSLVFIVYAGITIWSTTHEQLLMGSGVTLPLLRVDVPIVGFYVITPWFLVVLHLNLLLQVMLLSSKLRGFDDALTWSTNLLERRRELLRLDTFPVTQWLSGHDESKISRAALGIVYFTSIYMLPVAILLSMQLTFLPAHHSGITTTHRLAICADLMFLWLFSLHVRPLKVQRSEGLRWFFKRTQAPTKVFLGGVVTVSILFFSFKIAVAPEIPSWWIEINRAVLSWLSSWPDKVVRSVPRALDVSRKALVAEAPPPEVLAAYYQRGEPVDSAWLEHAQALDLTHRDLRLAKFNHSDLWNADFRNSRLDGAVLLGATLRGALFTTRETLGGGAVERSGAALRETDFTQAKFPEGDLLDAILVFSDLYEANFPGSDLRKAKLVGTRARFTDLRGAALARVEAQGVNFLGADLRGADLRGANLMAANLSSAKLQGADLRRAKLQGADFSQAKLHGADLRGAEVFSTKFDKAELTLADLRGITLEEPRGTFKALIEALEKYRPYTAGAIILHHHALERIRSRQVQGNKGISLEEVKHRDAIFDADGPFSIWGNPITPQKYESRLVPTLVSFACDDIHIAKGLLWERPDPDLDFYPSYGRGPHSAKAIDSTREGT
jgi:uncharacterized protein YjbI with pentapeptide repeats